MIKQLKQKTYNFLRWSQKYTKTDNVYLAKGGFWLTLGQVITTFASFLLAIAFANLLDPTTYGNYKYILSIVGILSIFALPGMGTAITQATARGLEGSFYKGFKAKLKYGVLGSLVAITGAIYYYSQGNHLLPIPLLISAIFLPLMQASSIYGSFLTGKKFFSVQTKYNTTKQIVTTGALIATLFSLYFFNLPTSIIIFALIAVYFVSNTSLNYSLYLKTKNKFQPNKKEDPQTFIYGKHLSLMNMVGTIASQLDRILLFTLIGSAELAIYHFALLMPDQIRAVSKNISTLALPKFSEKSPQEIKYSIRKKFWKLFFLAVITIVIYIITAPYIYKIFFPQYLDSISYSQIYILSLLTIPTGLMSASFYAKAKKKELYILQTMPFLQIILLISLIPFFGIIGALTAVLLTKALGIGVILLLFKRF